MSKLTLVFPLAAIGFILLVFSEYISLLRQPLQIPESGRRMTGKDRALCLLITAVYALVAFLGLGSTTGIESFCKFTSRGEYALIEFPEGVEISAVHMVTPADGPSFGVAPSGMCRWMSYFL